MKIEIFFIIFCTDTYMCKDMRYNYGEKNVYMWSVNCVIFPLTYDKNAKHPAENHHVIKTCIYVLPPSCYNKINEE